MENNKCENCGSYNSIKNGECLNCGIIVKPKKFNAVKQAEQDLKVAVAYGNMLSSVFNRYL